MDGLFAQRLGDVLVANGIGEGMDGLNATVRRIDVLERQSMGGRRRVQLDLVVHVRQGQIGADTREHARSSA